MAFLDIHFWGNSIQKQSSMYVILPDGDGPFPVLYLLHGLSDDHTIWHRRTSIERYAEGRPLIIVMPDGHRSFYCNDPRPGGLAYEDHMVKDVVGFMDRAFRTIRHRRGRAIAGLSMGGYGAMMLSLRHVDLFSVACSHSGALAMFHSPRPERADVQAVVANLPKGAYDCFALARKCARSRRGLAIRIDCGKEDFLLDHNRQFHAHLEKLGIRHVYEEHPGQHNWEYWDIHIRQTLEFVMARVKAPKK